MAARETVCRKARDSIVSRAVGHRATPSIRMPGHLKIAHAGRAARSPAVSPLRRALRISPGDGRWDREAAARGIHGGRSALRCWRLEGRSFEPAIDIRRIVAVHGDCQNIYESKYPLAGCRRSENVETGPELKNTGTGYFSGGHDEAANINRR